MADLDESKIASDNHDEFQRAWDEKHEQLVKDIDKHDRFYLGDQWDEAVLKALQKEGRPALTVNQMLPTINAIFGAVSENRVDMRFKSRNGGDSETATLLTYLFDYIYEDNDYLNVERQVAGDGIISDVGWFDVRMDFDTNVIGDIRIAAVDPREAILDMDAKEYDPDTWSQQMTHKWTSPDTIEATYGKAAADKIKALVAAGGTYGQDHIRFDGKVSFGSESGAVNTAPTGSDAVRRLRSVRVIERQHKRLHKQDYFVDMETGDVSPVPASFDPDRVEWTMQKYGLGVMSRVVPRIRWTVSADHVLLHDDWSPYSHFTMVPFMPLFRRGRFSGYARQLISPQEQLNKIESQSLHVVNTTANSGYAVEEGSLSNMTAEELEERGAQTGLVLVYKRGRKTPEKIQPNQIPTGLDRLGSKSSQFIREVSGVAALLGRAPNPEVSGVQMERAARAALSGLQPTLDNLNLSRRLVAKRVLNLIQEFYTETRVMRVTDWRSPGEPQMDVEINQPMDDGTVLNDVTIGKYDVIVGTAPARDGADESEFAEALQLREIGVQIPDHHIIKTSRLRDRDQIAEEVKTLQGMGDPSTEQAQLQQAQVELQMAEAQLRLQEIQAKIQKLQSESGLNMAKAYELQASAELTAQKQQADQLLAMEKIRESLVKHITNIQSKLELADKHIGAKKDITLHQTASKRLEKSLEAAAARSNTPQQ